MVGGRWKGALLLALALGAASACDDDDTNGADGGVSDGGVTDGGVTDGGVTDGGVTDGGVTDGGTAQKARVRFIHSSPDAPAVDIYATGNTTPLATSLSYGAASAFVDIDPGSRSFEVRPAGAAATSTPVFSSPAVTLAEGQEQTIVAAGLLNTTDSAKSLRAISYREDFGATEPGKARVHVVHASPDAPSPVGIDVGNDGSDEASIARFTESAAEGLVVTAGAPLRIALRSGSPSALITVFTLPALAEGSHNELIVTGLANRPAREVDGLKLLIVTPSSASFVTQDPMLFALHAAPDVAAVDLFSGGQELGGGLTYGQLSKPILVPAGDQTLDLFGATAGSTRPSGSPVLSASVPDLAAGERYLAIVTGLAAGSPALRVIALRDQFNVEAAKAFVRVVHAAPGTPAVDVGTVTTGTLTPAASNIDFGAASDELGIELAPGALVLGVAPTGTTTPVATFDVNVSAGLRSFAVAMGGAAGRPLQLGLIDTAVVPWSLTLVDAANGTSP